MTDIKPHRLQQKVVIVGNGIDAWLAASSLAHAVNKQYFSISVLGLETAGQKNQPFEFADATQAFEDHSFLPALNENRLISDCSAALSHGIAMSGWTKPDATYFQPFGSIGAALGPLKFLQVALCLRQQGATVRLADYCLAAMAAQSGKIVPAVKDSRSVLATCQHGMHIELNQLVDQLRSDATSNGIEILQGRFEYCEWDKQAGIKAITTSDGLRVEADLYIDCSGQQALLSKAGSDSKWQDWSEWLPCNYLLSAVISGDHTPPPYSHDFATRGGWIQDIPLQGKAVLNGIFDSNHCDNDGMLKQMLQYSGSSELEQIYAGPLRLGRQSKAWQHNCVALGGAACMIDPVASTNLQLLACGIQRLSRLLPGSLDTAAIRNEYNREMGLQFDHARDFAIMNYKLNGRPEDIFWKQCRDIELPEELDYKLRLYQSRGLVALYDEEPFDDTNWLNLFDEHGIKPRQYSTLADGFGVHDLQKHLQKIRAVMLETLAKLPTHAEYLAHIKRNKS